MAKECYQIPTRLDAVGHAAQARPCRASARRRCPTAPRLGTAPASPASSGSTRSGSSRADSTLTFRGGSGARADPPRTYSRISSHEVDVRYFLQRVLQFVIVFFLVTFGVMVFMRIGMNKPGRSGPDDARRHGQARGTARGGQRQVPPQRQLPRPVLVLAEGHVHRRLRDQRAAEHRPSPSTSAAGLDHDVPRLLCDALGTDHRRPAGRLPGVQA